MKKLLPILIITLASFALGACTVDFHTIIFEDESGEFRVIVEATEDEIDEVEDLAEDEGFGRDPEEWCDGLDDFLDDWGMPRSEINYSEGRDDYTCIITYAFDDFSELEDIYNGMRIANIDRLRINGDGELDYQLRVVNAGTPSEEDFRDEGAEVELDYSWSVTAPGNVVDHDGDELNGRTVVWNIRPRRETVVELESAPGGFAFPDFGLPFNAWHIVLFCCCCMSFLVIIVVLILFVRRRKKRSA